MTSVGHPWDKVCCVDSWHTVLMFILMCIMQSKATVHMQDHTYCHSPVKTQNKLASASYFAC